MLRIPSFFAGVLVGAGLVFTALKYHLVRADDGFHLVPKLSAQFSEAFVDIRQFELSDWNDHRSLAAALMQADKGNLVSESADNNLRRSLDHVLRTLRGENGG